MKYYLIEDLNGDYNNLFIVKESCDFSRGRFKNFGIKWIMIIKK